MPLFKSGNSADRVDRASNTSTSPPRRGSMFSDRGSPPSSARSGDGGRRSIWRRRSTSSSTDEFGQNSGDRRHSGSGSFFNWGRNHDYSSARNDPSILAARQKVTDAENAEREADDALTQARDMVKEARRHVEVLEREALEDAQRAKIKQAEARVVRKSARSLGRHG